MKRKLLTLFTLVALLIAFSIPVMQNNLSNSVIQNTMLSPLASYSSKGGSIDWQVQVSNAQGRAIAVTPNESYIYVAGAHLTNPTNSSSGKPTLWKYTTLGNPVWNVTMDNLNASSSFEDVAISPDGGSVYAAGSYPNGTITIPPYTFPLSDAIVVKFNASSGGVGWNYTLNGPSSDDIRAIAVSPDGKSVYVAGMLSKSSGTLYNSSFYVNALNASDGTPLWNEPYEAYENNSFGSAYDLVVSPSSEVVYACGYCSLSGGYLDLVALNTTDGNQLWNITGTIFTYYAFYSIEVSSNGSRIYALAPHIPEENFLVYNASDGSLLQNVTINRLGSHSYTGPLTFAISQDESKIYIPGIWLGSPNEEYMLLVEFDRLSGNPIGIITANNLSTYPYGIAASRDNKSVYITGVSAGNMFLLMGQPEPLPSGLLMLLLLYTTLSQNPVLSSSTSTLLVGVGIAAILVVASFLIARTMRGRRVENV